MTTLRPAHRGDIPACSRVMYDAFRDISERHNFPPDFPSAEVAGGLLTTILEAPGFDAFVAEDEGRIVGSIFVSRRSRVGGISVLTIDPMAQNHGVGRRLLQHGMEFLVERGHRRQQIVQAGYHNRSLCLYAKLGFNASELLSNMTGKPIRATIPERKVRRASDDDAGACNALCRKVHGFDRMDEVAHAIAQGTAAVVERGGRITGYTTGVGFVGHGVGETNEDLKALIASADEFAGPGILIPTCNGELFRWCIENGLRVVQQMTLMDTHPPGPPNGVYWPAVLS
ncbi:MAG: GNAT family N-acetyltransferase [Nitrospiraceae bacterium]|nr:GNAT family N-acetyltransferase [Nitrospiraceae bacterium]